jgi:hypothetical protein
MKMNTEQASKRAMWTPSLLKRDEGRRLGAKRATQAAPGATGVLVMVCGQRNRASTRETRAGGGAALQLNSREEWFRLGRVAERSVVAKKRVTTVEQRDLSSRATQKEQEPGRLT